MQSKSAAVRKDGRFIKNVGIMLENLFPHVIIKGQDFLLSLYKER